MYYAVFTAVFAAVLGYTMRSGRGVTTGTAFALSGRNATAADVAWVIIGTLVGGCGHRRHGSDGLSLRLCGLAFHPWQRAGLSDSGAGFFPRLAGKRIGHRGRIPGAPMWSAFSDLQQSDRVHRHADADRGPVSGGHRLAGCGLRLRSAWGHRPLGRVDPGDDPVGWVCWASWWGSTSGA